MQGQAGKPHPTTTYKDESHPHWLFFHLFPLTSSANEYIIKTVFGPGGKGNSRNMTKTNLTEYGLSVANAQRRQKWIKLLIYIGLAAGTLAAYEPMRHNEFVNYDDNAYITTNPNVTGEITLNSVIWAFTKPHAVNWHPLTWLSHMLDCKLFGLNPFGHHLVSLLFHIANAMLLFRILASMTGTTWASAFAAAVFALHPLQVESVAWAAERKTVLSGFFWLLTMLAYTWYTKQPRTGRYILLFLVYGLCIMTKPVVVTLPLALLLLDYWPLERLHLRRPTTGKTIPLNRLLLEKVPLLALSLVLSAITLLAQRQGKVIVGLERMPIDFRIANMFISYIRYIGKLIWPSRLAVFYPLRYTNFPIAAAVLCAIVFVLITVLVIAIGRRRKYVAMGWLWFVVTLVPVVGIVQSGQQAIADRYMYLPMLGLLFMAVWAVKELFNKRFFAKVFITQLALAVLLSAIIITRTQVRYWQNAKTLFEHTLKVTEKNAVAENGYGTTLFAEGQISEAEKHLRNALSIWPTYFGARNNLGKVLVAQGKLNEAIACFTELLPVKINLEELHYNLAAAYSMQNKYDEAIKHLTAVLDQNPNYLDAREKMGVAMLAAGRTPEAIWYFNEALPTSTNKANIYANLGTAYLLNGKKEQAIQSWTKAVQLKPNSVSNLNNLAWLLATRDEVSAEDANKAVGFAENACKLTEYKEPVFLDTLAVAYAAAGRFDDAVTIANKAINTAKAIGREPIANEIQERMKLYQAGRRYREKMIPD
jgi:protein O-mannosyl-transferase